MFKILSTLNLKSPFPLNFKLAYALDFNDILYHGAMTSTRTLKVLVPFMFEVTEHTCCLTTLFTISSAPHVVIE